MSFTILVDQPIIRLFQPKNEVIMLFSGSSTHFVIRVCAVQLHYNTVWIAFFFSTVLLYSKLNHIFFQILNKKGKKIEWNYLISITKTFRLWMLVHVMYCHNLNKKMNKSSEYLPGEQWISHKNNVKYGSELGCTLHIVHATEAEKNHQQSQLQVETHCWL